MHSLDGQSESSGIDPNAVVPNQASEKTPAKQLVVGKVLLVDLGLILLWVIASDWLLFRNGSFAACGVFFAWSALFFCICKRSLPSVENRRCRVIAGLAGMLLVGLAMKLLWCGSWFQVLAAVAVLLSYAMALTGAPPFLPELAAFVVFVLCGACERLSRFRLGSLNSTTGVFRPFFGLHWMLPMGIVSLFLAFFTFANPDLYQSVSAQILAGWDSLSLMVQQFGILEFLFWIVSAWLMLGMLYPVGRWLMKEKRPEQLEGARCEFRLYEAYRNTLISVVVLFALYLSFEFMTFGFREFPDDFYYAGYAHRGAFWLTVALAFSTLVLSVVFSGDALRDPRLGRLKVWALGWSALNLLLSVAVVNRLLIYINFNGLTQMRVIGLLGIVCVVVGFILVVYKFVCEKGFVWLIHRQSWVPLSAGILYALLPVDWIVNAYNVSQVQKGNVAASVQIIAHLTKAEGVLPLVALADHEDPKIRDGVRALLALWAQDLGVGTQSVVEESSTSGRAEIVSSQYDNLWKSGLGHSTPWATVPSSFSDLDHSGVNRESASSFDWQFAEQLLRSRLRGTSGKWSTFDTSRSQRDEAINAFFEYAYQWY